MPPDIAAMDIYIERLCEEKHIADRAAIAELRDYCRMLDARLRAMEVRIYIIVGALTVGGGAVGDALGKLFS